VKITVTVAAAVVASVLWWGAVARVVAPGSHGAGTAGPTELSAQAAAGGAIMVRWGPPAVGPAPLRYQIRVVPVGGGAVTTAQTWSRSVVVPGLEVGRTYHVVVGADMKTATATASATAPPVTVLADQAPDPPVAVVVTQQPATNSVQASWTPAATGMAATGANVQLYDGPDYRGYLTCQATCTSANFDGLAYGRRYSVRVVPLDSVGQGPAVASGFVDLRNPCPAVPVCVDIDATTATGPARQRAMGFLNSLYPVGDMRARVQALGPYGWRGSPTYQPGPGGLGWSSWDAAVSSGAATTMLLSNLWHAETTTGSGAKTPWSDWAAYAQWVTATVKSIEASGHRVSYWEIQNEPGAPDYFSPVDGAAATAADYLDQFRVAYGAIKAADPAAAVIGPSLAHFSDYPGEYDPHEPDLVTFLDFAARNGMRLAAITWHEIDDDLGPRPRDFNNLPATIEDHVAEARQLVAERPALGHPQVWVNEYGRRMDYAIPGWALGEIAALERAGVDHAGRSCWPGQNSGGSLVDDCAAPTLDGLLLADGSTPRADYFVYGTYARMKGQLVPATASDGAVSVLASRVEPAGQVVAMVGRDVGCLPGPNLSCHRGTPAPLPVAAVVAVHLPGPSAGQADVSVLQIAPAWGPAAPVAAFRGPLAVTAGVVTVPLPALADGEVYVVTVGRH